MPAPFDDDRLPIDPDLDTEAGTNAAPGLATDDVATDDVASAAASEPDAGASSGGRPPRARPLHLRARSVLLVALGGAVGTAARAVISTVFPANDGVSWSIFWINVAGAFLLGALLESLAVRGPDEGARRTLRLLCGTGFLGGFTTYSSLAAASASLMLDGRDAMGAVYALVTLVAGAAATAVGLVTASWMRPAKEAGR